MLPAADWNGEAEGDVGTASAASLHLYTKEHILYDVKQLCLLTGQQSSV